MIIHLFIEHKCIEHLLCILDFRDPTVNRKDKGDLSHGVEVVGDNKKHIYKFVMEC